MHAIFKEIFVIPHRKPVWKYVGCSEWQQTICGGYKIQLIIHWIHKPLTHQAMKTCVSGGISSSTLNPHTT
jgi:hypothetical protein